MLIFATTVLVLAAGAFGVVVLNVFGWRRLSADHAAREVSVLIPARDEADNLPSCLDAVLKQENVAEVIVADDHSTDQTPQIVREYSRRDSRVKLIQTQELPEGWCGKTHACQTLSDKAVGEWLLFIDADARLQKEAVSRMLAECEGRRVTLLSCWPQLEMRGFFERLLMPLLNFVLLTLYPAPLAARRENVGLGLAHGACILLRADVYRQFGGHTRVKSELFEDTRLAQLWRAEGHRGVCLDGTGVVSVRMYSSLSEIWSGFRKNLFPAFRSQYGFWAFMVLHVSVFLAPFVLLLHGGTAGALFALAAVLIVAARLALAIRFRHSLWSALLHPVGEAFVLLIGFASWWQVISGRGVSWKGRQYLQRDKQTTSPVPVKETA